MYALEATTQQIPSWFNHVTFWIAVAGFLMSLVSWICTAWNRRKRLKVTVDLSAPYNKSYMTSLSLSINLAFWFESKSTNPIAINCVWLIFTDKSEFRSELSKLFVCHNFRRLLDTNTEYYERFTESADFPIEIGAYGAAYEYIQFTLPKECKERNLDSIRIMTNRGKIIISDEKTICSLQEFFQKTPAYKPDDLPVILV